MFSTTEYQSLRDKELSAKDETELHKCHVALAAFMSSFLTTAKKGACQIVKVMLIM